MSKAVEITKKADPISFVPNNIPEEITESDEAYFQKVVSTELDARQRRQILEVPDVFPRQETVLAVHWHPEHVPMDLIRQRIDTMFPNKKESLIIPTQHNEIMSYDGYCGVEVDCYSSGFNQKVQLLLHFEEARMGDAHVLNDMLAHTFKYRSSQLFDFIRTITRPDEERLNQAARRTGANEALVNFVQLYVKKIEKLLDQHITEISPRSIKNKILRNFFDCLRQDYGENLIDRAQTFLTAVKKIVKFYFPLHYFFRTSEIIEEARSLNAGIVIPHPEQFWPVLLANYNVDGIEVWNPQSHRYTDFLVSVLNEKNRLAQTNGKKKELLIFMGDDTHMGEKTRDPKEQNPVKAAREIGVQPAWDDLSVGKTLIKAHCSRETVIEEYKARLAG